MQVVNLVSWGGANFSYEPGDVVDLPDDVAEARIEAGLAETVVEAAAAAGLALTERPRNRRER